MLSSLWLNEWWTKIYFLLIRPMLKWFLRKVTGKCELLRITYEEADTVERTIQIEDSLRHSSDADLKHLATDWNYDVQEKVKAILAKKTIVTDVHPQCEIKLTTSLTKLRAYNRVQSEVEELRKTKFSSDNQDHEDRLVELWSLWKKEPLPGRTGEHWTELGFQGHDPQTDFRGMGMLGLEQLMIFAREFPNAASQVLSQSHHPSLGFSLAIVGINLSQLGHSLLVKRRLRTHMYRLDKPEPDLNDFHRVYCYLLYEFTQFWVAEKPKDIMEFNRVRNKFKHRVKGQLQQKGKNCILSSPFMKEDS